MFQYLVLLTIPLAIYGGGIYIIDIIAGKSKPNKVSWLMWSANGLIAAAAGLSEGVTWAVLPVFMSGFVPLCVLAVSFFNKGSYWKLIAFDYICGFFSALALILWWVTKEADVAIIFAIISDIFAAVPTLKKMWNNPETESAKSYVAGLISSITGFAAIKNWVFSEYAYVVYLVIMESCLIISIYRKKLYNKYIK